MISNEAIREKLCGYPEPILEQYERYQETRDQAHLHGFVIGLLRFLQDADETTDTHQLSDSTQLREDLGVDSITIAEVIFQLEEIFEIEIDNQDLMNIHTVGELKQYIISKVN